MIKSRLLITFVFIFCGSTILAQLEKDSIEQPVIHSDRDTAQLPYYILPASNKDTLSISNISNLFKNKTKGIAFFYPENGIKHHNDSVVQAIVEGERFHAFELIGIPCIKTKNDRDNLYFESVNISNIQCLIFSSDSTDLYRAQLRHPEFIIIEANLPPNFYLIDIDKNVICVTEERIAFYQEFIYEFVDPRPTCDEKIFDLNKKVESLKSDFLELQKKSAESINQIQQEFDEKYKELVKTKKDK